MITASAISTLFGKMARFSTFKRGRRLNHRFLCPNCLHFGCFNFVCGACWAKIPGYAGGKKTQSCPRCRRSLLSADGDGVRAYCGQCKWVCDCAIYHQRQVRVLATLRPADSQSLYRAISGQEYQPQGGRGYVYDDGAWLIYVLNLSDFSAEAYSLPPEHALWQVESIWLDVSANNPKETALEWGEVADRFIAQAKLTDAQRQAMTVCVHQIEVDSVVKPGIETRFGKARYGVSAPVFLCDREQAKTTAMGEITHNSNVPALIAKLKYHGWDARQQAVEALVKIGKPAMHALCEALKDSNQYVRYSAADVLGEIGDNSAVHALIAAFDMFVRSLRAEPLVKIGKPAVPALSEALKDSNVYMRRSAAEALGKIGDNSAVPALIAALKDSDPSVRRSAAEALGKIGDNSSVPALCEAGKDSNVYVRRSAAEALVKIGKLAVPALCEALKDNDPSVRSSAAEALGKIGDNSAVLALIAALKDSDQSVRSSAAEALGMIGDNSAVPALCAALKDNDPSVRRSAAEALGKIGDNSVVPAL